MATLDVTGLRDSESNMAIYELEGIAPRLARDVWIASDAHVIGDVSLGAETSIWFGTIVRGDSEAITIGRKTNVQDQCVCHADEGQPLKIGDDVSVGHQAMLHGCTIGDGALVGIGAIILNGAIIGKRCLVGAGALVTEGKVFPEASLILGSPAKVVRPLSEEELARLARVSAHYVANARRFLKGLRGVD